MEGEPMAGSAKAALDLIYDQECALLGGEFASAPVELFGYWTNSALTLNRFDHNGADVVCELFLEIFDVVKFAGRDGAFGLVADIDENFAGANFDDAAFYDTSLSFCPVADSAPKVRPWND